MRSASNEVKEKTREKPVAIKSSFDYGFVFVLQAIMEELNLNRKPILLCYLRQRHPWPVHWHSTGLCVPSAMNNVDSRYEGPSLVLESPQINLTGQRSGELLGQLGESNILDRFISQLIEETGMKDTLIYDITSLSNCSQPINFLNMRAIEMQNHFHKSINLDSGQGIPVMYDIFPGSISNIRIFSIALTKSKNINNKNLFLS